MNTRRRVQAPWKMPLAGRRHDGRGPRDACDRSTSGGEDRLASAGGFALTPSAVGAAAGGAGGGPHGGRAGSFPGRRAGGLEDAAADRDALAVGCNTSCPAPPACLMLADSCFPAGGRCPARCLALQPSSFSRLTAAAAGLFPPLRMRRAYSLLCLLSSGMSTSQKYRYRASAKATWRSSCRAAKSKSTSTATHSMLPSTSIVPDTSCIHPPSWTSSREIRCPFCAVLQANACAPFAGFWLEP